MIKKSQLRGMSEYLAKAALGVKYIDGKWYGTLNGYAVAYSGRSEKDDAYKDAIAFQELAMKVYINKATRGLL